MILTLVTRVSQHVRGDKMSAADMGIVITPVVRQYGNAIVSDGIMEMFVTYQLQPDGCACRTERHTDSAGMAKSEEAKRDAKQNVNNLFIFSLNLQCKVTVFLSFTQKSVS